CLVFPILLGFLHASLFFSLLATYLKRTVCHQVRTGASRHCVAGALLVLGEMGTRSFFRLGSHLFSATTTVSTSLVCHCLMASLRQQISHFCVDRTST